MLYCIIPYSPRTGDIQVLQPQNGQQNRSISQSEELINIQKKKHYCLQIFLKIYKNY